MNPTNRLWRTRTWLMLVATVISLVAAETAARWGLLHSKSSRLGDPAAYFDPLCDEDYWRALRRGRFGAHLHRVGPNDQDPLLGWIPTKNSLDDVLALATPHSPQAQKTVALFGDSYIFGTTTSGTRISDVLAAARPDTRVLNFGVGGYGLDQIVLRVEDRAAVLQPGDQVIIGVMTTDIDRAMLKVRDAPKPWFSLEEEGSLKLHLPPQQDSAAWFMDNPVEAHSLLWSRLSRAIQVRSASPAIGPECETEHKKALASAIFGRLESVCRQSQLSCQVLLLYRPIDLEYGSGWRGAAIRDAKQLTVLDSEPWFVNSTVDWRDLYGADRHPNAEGNANIAAGLDRNL